MARGGNHDWRPGYCAPTTFTSRVPDCERDSIGAWSVRKGSAEAAARQRCAARCSRCARCRYVSFSANWADCSWFAEGSCNFTRLRTDVPGYATAAVSPANGGAVQGSRAALRLQRRRNATSRPPLLIIIYHMAKTGGTGLMTMINGWAVTKLEADRGPGVAEARRRKPLAFQKGAHGCFWRIFPSVFPDAQSGEFDWRHSHVALEFHGKGREEYWSAVVPHLPTLRNMYAAAGGRVVTTTCTRTPATMMRSTYKMWPPRISAAEAAAAGDGRPIAWDRGKRVGLMAFAEALAPTAHEHAGLLSGLMARELLAWQRTPAEFACSREEVARARRRLASFDVVGVTECTPRYWAALGAVLPGSIFRLPAVVERGLARGTDAYFKPAEPNLEFRNWAAASADDELSPAASAALAAAARCDAPLHADGMRLAGVLPAAAELAEGEAADDEGAWLRALQQHEPACGRSTT